MIGIAHECEVDGLIREEWIIELPEDHLDVLVISLFYSPRQLSYSCVCDLNCIHLSLRADRVREEKGKVSVARTDVGYMITLFQAQ